MPNGKFDADDIDLWARLVGDDGEEHFIKIRKLTEDEINDFNADEEENNPLSFTTEELIHTCADNMREKYYLLGMVQAYENVLGIQFDDEDEEEED